MILNEDIEEHYYIFNTNTKYGKTHQNDMLKNKKCATYYKDKIYVKKLNQGDVIFLYQSRVGIIAFGEANGNLCICDYQNNPDEAEEEYSMNLNNFYKVKTPLIAREIKKITGKKKMSFRPTMFSVHNKKGKKIKNELMNRL